MELLDPVEARVLGALMEKEVTTPEYYPLSLNALVNAANQKSNRDPVVDYDEDTVSDAVDRLREKKMSLLITGSGRVNKFQQRISETLNLGRRESAVLCTLLLRGSSDARRDQRSQRAHVCVCRSGGSGNRPGQARGLARRRAGGQAGAPARPERSALCSSAVWGARGRVECRRRGRAAHRPGGST